MVSTAPPLASTWGGEGRRRRRGLGEEERRGRGGGRAINILLYIVGRLNSAEHFGQIDVSRPPPPSPHPPLPPLSSHKLYFLGFNPNPEMYMANLSPALCWYLVGILYCILLYCAMMYSTESIL